MKTKLPGSNGEHKAQEFYGTTKKALAFYNKQVLNYLNPLMIEFLEQQDMAFIATADSHGECDCSLRAGLQDYLFVIDDTTITYPEYRGNGVLASIGNIIENPHIGMILIDFQQALGLHINGKASIVNNDKVMKWINRPGVTKNLEDRKIERWVYIEIEEAYIHCSKHIPLMATLDKNFDWGTDDVVKKGGDAFNAKECYRPWVDVNE